MSAPTARERAEAAIKASQLQNGRIAWPRALENVERAILNAEREAVEPLRAFIVALADGLESAYRMGSEHDEPEGSRFIQMSDTVTRNLVARARALLAQHDAAKEPR